MLAFAALIMQSVAFQVVMAAEYNPSEAEIAQARQRARRMNDEEKTARLAALHVRIQELTNELTALRTRYRNDRANWTVADHERIHGVNAALQHFRSEYDPLNK